MSGLSCSGAFIYALDTNRLLLLHRATSKHSHVWGLVGGKNELKETPANGLQREIFEEIGPIDVVKTIPLEWFVSYNNNFNFHTYICIVNHEFIPKLNNEHDGYSWFTFPNWPMPLHPGLSTTLSKTVIIEKMKTVFSVFDSIYS